MISFPYRDSILKYGKTLFDSFEKTFMLRITLQLHSNFQNDGCFQHVLNFVEEMEYLLIQVLRNTYTALFLIMVIKTTTAEITEFVTDSEIVDRLVLEFSYMNLKDQSLVNPYNRFQSNYLQLSVCSWRRSQKIEVCDMVLGNDSYQYLRPRKFKPSVHCMLSPTHTAAITYSTMAFKCPTTERLMLNTLRNPPSTSTMHTASYFISSASQPNSIILYYEYPGSRKWFKPDMTVLNLPTRYLQKLVKKERNKPFQGIAHSFLPLMYHDILPQRHFDWLTTTFRNAPIAENDVLLFERNVKMNTMPYRKFQATYSIKGLCGYSQPNLIYICVQVMANDAFGFEVRSDFESDYRCKRRFVHFQYSEGHTSSSLYLVQCHLMGFVNKNSYFISTSAVSNKLLVHIQYNPHPEILPEGYALDVIEVLEL